MFNLIRNVNIWIEKRKIFLHNASQLSRNIENDKVSSSDENLSWWSISDTFMLVSAHTCFQKNDKNDYFTIFLRSSKFVCTGVRSWVAYSI